MNLEFTERVQRVEPSATLAISQQASELEAEGVDVVDLSVGEPDFQPPDAVIAAGKAAMDAGHNGYTSPNGIPALKEAISEEFASDGLSYRPEEIIVTPGGKQALFEVILSVIGEGDEVVLLDPAWVSYESMVKIAGGSLNRVDLSPHGFQLEPALDEFRAAVSDDTALVIINSPSNPTGAVYSRAALEAVRDVAVEHDVLVISDEIYKEITYVDEYTHLGTLQGMSDRTVTVNGFSKAFAMTGWRLGYYGAPKALVDQAGKIHSHSVSCAANFVQHAGVEALERAGESVESMRGAFEERRDLVVDLMEDAGVEIPEPKGAFYVMIPVSGDDQEWCTEAINEAHVATVPGRAFGTPGFTRISYANSSERLKVAFERLQANRLL